MKKILMLVLGMMVMGQLFAGGIDNKQNLGSLYMGEPTRNVAIDAADIAAFNPAGIMLGEDGLGLRFDCQYVNKKYEHTYTDAREGKKVTKDQNAPSIIPNAFATYKKNNWGLFGSFTINGGGGTVDYKDGNATTYGLCASFASSLKTKTGATAVSFANDAVKASSVYYTMTTGGAYQVNEQISVALGARYIYADKSIEASADFTPVGGVYNGVVQDLKLEYLETAHGFGGVVSVDYVPIDPLRFALRYESQVNLDFELEDKSNTNGTSVLAGQGKKDGDKNRRDLPALLGFGANYEVNDKLSFATSLTYYFDENATWDSYNTTTKTSYNLADKVSDNSYDWALSAKYIFSEKIWGTIGYMRTENNLSASNYTLGEQMSPPLDCNSYSMGGGYKFTKEMSVNLSYMANVYESESGSISNSIPVEYSKLNNIFALGFEYRM